MLHTILQGVPELSLILITAVATHFFMSLAQTLMHYALGHHPIGGKFFRNHIAFHHTYYCGDHLVSKPTLVMKETIHHSSSFQSSSFQCYWWERARFAYCRSTFSYLR